MGWGGTRKRSLLTFYPLIHTLVQSISNLILILILFLFLFLLLYHTVPCGTEWLFSWRAATSSAVFHPLFVSRPRLFHIWEKGGESDFLHRL